MSAAIIPVNAAKSVDTPISSRGTFAALDQEPFMRKTLFAVLSFAALSVGAAASAAPSPADIAAANEAMRAFMAQRQSCGDKIVTALDVTPPQSGGFAPSLDFKPQKPYTIYNEAVNIERQIGGQGSRMNDADRLNGLQWKGRVQLVAKAAREIRVTRGGGGPDGAWSQWQPNVTLGYVEVELRNGVWQTNVQTPQIAAFGRFAQLRRASCAEVPS
ncbi:MAG: hypothetical protein U1E60_20000 [Reyranellaceae bacterium]